MKGLISEKFQIYSDKRNSKIQAILFETKKHKNKNIHNNLQSMFNHSTHTCSNMLFKGDDFNKCVYDEISTDFQHHFKASDRLHKLFDKVADHYRNYTCRNITQETTKSISSYSYMGIDNKQYTINILLNRSHAKVWTVDDMISDDECVALMTEGRPKLTRATTAGSDGTGEVNEVRKAQQASYFFNGTSDPLW